MVPLVVRERLEKITTSQDHVVTQGLREILELVEALGVMEVLVEREREAGYVKI